MKTIKIGLINVVLPPPHDAQRYIDLFRAVFRRRHAVPLRGDYKGLIGALGKSGDELVGQFYRFLEIDVTNPWFDIERHEPASEEDVARIKIPEHLKPHHKVFDFVLFPKAHKVAYVAQNSPDTMGPTTCKKLLDGLFADEDIKSRFGVVHTTIEPHRDQLQKILRMNQLRKLVITIRPPNPDDLAETEKEILERMRRENAGQYQIALMAEPHSELKPDEDHRTLASVAQSNGDVTGTGRDESGRTIEVSTANAPILENATYDSNVETLAAVLRSTGSGMIEHVRIGRRHE